VDSLCQKARLVKLPFGKTAGIERNGGEGIISGELASAFGEGGDRGGKDLEKVTAPPKFNLVENLFDRIFVAKKAPRLIPVSERKPDPLFGGGTPQLLEIFPARKTEASFLQFKELVTEGANTGVEKSQEGLPVTRKPIC